MTNKKKRNIRNCSYPLFFAPQKTRLKLIIYKSVTHLKWMHKLMNKIMLNQFENLIYLQAAPRVLQLFRRMLQRRFAVNLQKCFVYFV